MQGPCEHCGNPDKSKWTTRCRYSWYLPYREQWKRSGADAPCSCDQYDEDQRSRRVISNRRIIVVLVLLASVMVGALYLGF